MKALNLVVFVVMVSCVNRKMDAPVLLNEAGCSPAIPDSVSFSAHIQPIFTQNCALPACHSGNSPQGGLNLESANAYAQISRRSRGYVNVATPRNSGLYNSLTSPANIMPPTGKLDDCKIETIMRWMEQGAQNN